MNTKHRQAQQERAIQRHLEDLRARAEAEKRFKAEQHKAAVAEFEKATKTAEPAGAPIPKNATPLEKVILGGETPEPILSAEAFDGWTRTLESRAGQRDTYIHTASGFMGAAENDFLKREKAREVLAVRMLRDGTDLNTIAVAAGLSVAEVDGIRQKLEGAR
jgi:hypothetical protein